ncbi:Spy/CpxP family protein refolding chaperone [Rhodanobacter sp. A1T4]|jgi:periplasmic protein CpxP/Spy|uniref:Spy/CpxP family protein refolding chaperone n=1 Tax=Rhodanobacter sp. A1T4 TaxID=2723087 RepID=UPI00160FCA53|nr:Spy/CpxP family protein refolding chaperone [Rhodanobacter sp. A1T4]MBB6245722.1 Spy/CpxP family protein refolding chaperone [Rhodanobacter sp. A1T4]
MRKSLTLSLVLASAMALTTLAVSAQQGPGGWHGGHGGHGHGQFLALSKLNLTTAQQASIKQIVQTSFAQNKTQRQALHQQREAFEALTPDQVGYQAAAASLAQAEGAATTQRVQQQAAIRTQIYAVLTTQQKAQYATLKTQQQARKAQWEQFKAQNPVSTTAASTSSQAQ